MKPKILFLAIALFGMLVVGCEDEPHVTDSCDTVPGIDDPTVKSVWATSVPDYSIKFTVLDSNWVHCDVHNESDYTFSFLDNCDYKYEWYDGSDDAILIRLQKDGVGVLTDICCNEIYILDWISQDSVVLSFGGTVMDEACEWCVFNFYLHRIQ